MMKFIFSLLLLMMFSLNLNFWLIQIMLLLLLFMFMFNYYSNYFWVEISYIFGSDMLSYSMVLLSFWICFLMMMASSKLYIMNNYFKIFSFINLILLLSLYLTFSSLNMFIFYLFFEISLIPTLIMIIGWGYQPERLEAGVYLLFYTLLMSLPMMIILFYIYLNFGFLSFFFSVQLNYTFMYLCMNMVFFVKIPMFFIHLWLPKAHVEAPVAGSMILAGIMLKLGGYGLMRFMYYYMQFMNTLNILIISLCLMGGVFISMICIRQSDMKSLIAYSSVSHMSLVLAGLMSYNYFGFWGSLCMMIAHGLCSSGLFCLVNIIYERTYSRSLYLNKGLLNLVPSMSLWWFLLLSSNMAAPPSLNLISEIMLINSLIGFNSIIMVLLILMSFFSAVYSLFLYSYSQHGLGCSSIYFMFNMYSREYLLLFLHWIPLNILFLKLDFLVEWL
uniref:NADH-ubiquinone oxidoreductase chain 4 n=1 Tax=Omophoita sp. REN-2018 TaxID=2506509 RepID=A0A411D9Y5_9CUCU|nr:NADH dehydrogenase subunit 4 [Omophoita sp. REN-2018]